MNVHLQPVRVATGSDDENGWLVFADGWLVAVLVRLSDQHEEHTGGWFLEAGFGRLAGPSQPIFADLDEAQAWIAERLARPQGGRGAGAAVTA